ncbi:MAG: type II toxin-antitoxin system Phd/YefM family antitoxin [Pseudomonadales bacterium]|mgnify:CR=1 FL=1|nr:type II toxin-antitoxin system Phd/YefM family antitoxin [Pseudomonadales bacterium]
MDRIDYGQDIKPLSDFRANVSSYVQQVTENKRPMVITQHGKGVAILCDVSEFEAMQLRLELLDEIYKAEAQIDEGRGISHDDARKMVLKGILP